MNRPVIDLIMPMLGKGTRMEGIQNGVIKPLLRMPDGDPFFVKAFTSLNNYKIRDIILVIPEEYKEEFIETESEYHDLLTKDSSNLLIVSSDYTDSPVQTLSIALKFLKGDISFVVLDCDIYSELDEHNFNEDDVHLFVFNTNEDNKSFIKVDENNNVIDVKEKVPISNMAIFGAYMFKNKQVLEQSMNGSEYISDIVRSCLDNNKIISYNLIKDYEIFGTKEEYEETIKQY